VVSDKRAQRREVEIGLRRVGIVEIRSSLEAGDIVVRSGHKSVSDGDPVRVVAE
jgi:membrane fusion protein (multidrug efflux system)